MQKESSISARSENHAEALKSLIRDEYLNSLYKTAKDLCDYSDLCRETHEQTCSMLESENKRKLLVMPRGTFKSSIGVVANSVWHILKNPNIRILIDSEKYENSKNFIREIKSKLTSPRIVSLFGDFQSDNKWAEREFIVSKRTKDLKEATVTASGIGAGKTGQHYDLIICDDLNTIENSENQEQRKKIIRHYQMNISILDPGGTLVVIGTRYAVDDVIGYILENEVNHAA